MRIRGTICRMARSRCALLLVLLVVGFGAQSDAQRSLHLPPLDRVLPPRAEAIYRAVAPRIDIRAALGVVGFMSPLWRLAGNPDYDRSLDFISQRLQSGGFAQVSDGRAATTPAQWIDRYDNSGQGWSVERGTLSLDRDGAREIVLSREQDRLALCINSFSTPAGGLTLPLVDLGAGALADFAGRDVKGAVVVGDAPVGALWARAVRERGAAGVISTDVAGYTRPAETPDVLQWGAIPQDEERRSFAFKATPRATRRLRDAVAAGPARVHVEIAATQHRGPNRTLVAEIPGSDRSAERVVLVAHVQEPGANDNASGSGTLLSVALALADGVASARLTRPRRTVTFLWLDEIRGSERWIADDAARARGVVAMMSLDMTGQDTEKTGGTFLIEKSPDPSAVWARPSDPHSEWGAGTVDRTWVRGHLLNDLHLAVALRRARDTGWVVRTNPYEGGSDHTVFTRHGVPALLNWHFTDRYYHTNLDTPDKVSGATMGNVAASVATTAMFLASVDVRDGPALLALVNAAEKARGETEAANAASREILDAWRAWYEEARASIARLTR
jgi:aminopeptidase YwaD